MTLLVRGSLLGPSHTPTTGERFAPVVDIGATRIEQILSSATPEPTTYMQEHEEWVVVLAGSATLDVDGERCDLAAGDWVVLPSGTPHRVLTTAAGTNWLAVHVGR